MVSEQDARPVNLYVVSDGTNRARKSGKSETISIFPLYDTLWLAFLWLALLPRSRFTRSRDENSCGTTNEKANEREVREQAE